MTYTRMEFDTMANVKKMTKRDYFEQFKSKYALTEDEIAFIDHEIELLNRKNSTERKPTAKQVENEGIKSAILNGMEIGKLYTITALIKEIPECEGMTNQKVSAIVRQMVGNEIVRTEDKRKAYFSLA